MGRRIPNILITGTPGTGKSTLCAEICRKMRSMEWINVGEVAREEGLLEGWDETLASHVIDEDKVVDALEERLEDEEGGKVVEYHGCDFFPQEWFDCVFVLTTNNTTLYDRLRKRGYSGRKLESNIECEIFQTLLEEAREAYPKEIVHALTSDTPEDLERNVEQICNWVQAYTN
ncbi:hypothetical protein JTE90_001980 [Oedothorax gibbosus]|uniref:Adenylate kinase isoenzyme 6 homolog n=1 Tax=Oedothorax gibbosus TaxID=931172 RepID=A0AAV6TYK2_9ARAC|nr:hypothetical protein JTE90_001980 [Oedothorax gibbosus]